MDDKIMTFTRQVKFDVNITEISDYLDELIADYLRNYAGFEDCEMESIDLKAVTKEICLTYLKED